MRTSPLKGLMKKSPITDKRKARTDSTVKFDPETLRVDSTPVGQTTVDEGGYGWSEAVKSGNKPASMWKNKRDQIATEKLHQSNIEKSSKSEPGIGGMIAIMPQE